MLHLILYSHQNNQEAESIKLDWLIVLKKIDKFVHVEI